MVVKMTRIKGRDAVTAFFWVILGLIISIWSATFPLGTRESIGPGIMPLACGMALVLLGSLLLFQARKRPGLPSKPAAPLVPRGAAFTRVALSIGGLLLSALAFDLLGFILTFCLLILFLMQVIQRIRWGTAISYTLLFTFGTYLVFHFLLKAPLPRGLIGF